MKKLIIIGSPGAGKSTLATKLGSILGIPVVHLDSFFWKPGWLRTTKNERLAILEEITVYHNHWILDGNYENVIDYQLGITEGVILFNFPRYVCYWRVIKRRLSYIGKAHPEIAPGCPDKIDWDLLRTIWSYPSAEGKIIREKILNNQRELHVIELRSTKEAERFIADIEKRCQLPTSWQSNTAITGLPDSTG